jgi:hypothetical protein
MSRRAVLMEALAATPRDLERLLRPVAREQLGPLADTLADLAEGEARSLARLRAAMGKDGDAPAPAATDVSPAELLACFVQRRRETRAFLEYLDQRDWGRWVEDGQPIRLRDYVQAMVTQDNQCLDRILELREALVNEVSR